jgi:hypothetical protein
LKPTKKKIVKEKTDTTTPDWNCNSSTYGGDHKDYKFKDKVFFYPHPRGKKRGVEARIDSYVGISPGARHFQPIIEEEDNAFWDPACQTWRKPYGDKDCEGANIRGPSFTTTKNKLGYEAAREWAENALKIFDLSKYKIKRRYDDGFKDAAQWRYRNGD